LADAAPGSGAPAGVRPEQVADLLRSADPEARALGLDLAQRLDRAPFLAELRQLAPSADRPTRRQLATLLGRAPAEQLHPLLDELLDSGDLPGQLIALQVKLARGDGLAEPHAERLVGSPSRSVAALAALVLRPPGAAAGPPGLSSEILSWCRDAEVAADVIDACVQARRSDLGDLLIATIEAAPHEQQRQGLAVLPALVSADHAGAAALAVRLAHHSDPRLRAEAVGALGAVADSPQALQALGDALRDRSRLVRQRAAAALAARGDRAIPIAARQLDATDPGVVEAAISTLGRIGSRRATQILGALLAPLYRAGIRNLDWLGRLPHGPEDRAWLALELTLRDHNRRLVDMVLNVVAALGASREVTDLRLSLAAADRRTRANALEALLALPQRRLVQPILPLLEAVYASEALVAGQPEATRSDPAEILAAAAQATDLWVRCGAAHTANALAAAQRPSNPGRDRSAVAPPGVMATELDMDRVLLLKRVALFRSLPLDTLLAVGRVLERRQYLDRDTILEAGTPWDHFCIVESGAVDLFGPGGAAERLSAPAYFGELILADDRVRAPRVVAAGDCVLLRLHRIVFRDLSRDYPDMLMELCKLLARRLRHQEGGAPG
jgi:HEAT repeat protein